MARNFSITESVAEDLGNAYKEGLARSGEESLPRPSGITSRSPKSEMLPGDVANPLQRLSEDSKAKVKELSSQESIGSRTFVRQATLGEEK